jgi:hypothetical protein
MTVKSHVIYPSETGAQTAYAVPFAYLARAHVKATVDGVEAPFTFLSSSIISFSTAPVGRLRIYRETPADELLNTYFDGSVLIDDDLNASFYQTLFIAEELRDNTLVVDTDGVIDANGFRITNAAEPTANADAVNKGYVDSLLAADLATITSALNTAVAASISAEEDATAAALASAGISAAVASASSDAARAEAAADALGYASDKAAVLSLISSGSVARLPASLTSMTLTEAEVPAFLAGFHLVEPGDNTEIILPEMTASVSTENIFKFAQRSGLLTIRGAAPGITSLTSVASVTGSAFNWDVVLIVADGSVVQPGNVLKLWNVGPLPSLSGDNAFLLRSKPIDNEVFTPHVRIGGMTITAGTNTATFTAGTLSDHIETGWLFHRGNQTNVATGINDGTRTITFQDNWTVGAAGETCYLVTKPGIGSATLSGPQPSNILDFANGITATQLNIGDLILVRGMSVKITNIIDSNTVELSHAVSFTGGAPYSIVTPGTLHEGGWLVTAVSGNQVTVKNRCAVKPPVNNVAGGEVIAIKTVLHQTTTGDGAFPVSNGAVLNLEDIALRGSYTSAGSHGIAGNGRDPIYGPTQSGVASLVTLGYKTAVIDFGRNYYGTYGCVLNARGTMWTGARETNVWADIGSDVNLRHCVAAGALSGDGIRYGAGTTGKTTETRANGNYDEGFQTFMGAENYGEIPYTTGNLGMGARIQGGQADCGQAVSVLNGLSGIYISEPGGNVKMPNSIIMGNLRDGIETDKLTTVDADGSFISGCAGATGPGYAINANNRSVVSANKISAGGNKLGLRAANGAQIDAHNMAPVLSVAGVVRANEFDLKGSIIRTSEALSTGVSALAINGGSVLSFFKVVTTVFNFPLIVAGGTQTTTVAVSGASATSMVAMVNSNSPSSGVTFSAQITSSGTVTVTAENNSGADIDPGNATITVVVLGTA